MKHLFHPQVIEVPIQPCFCTLCVLLGLIAYTLQTIPIIQLFIYELSFSPFPVELLGRVLMRLNSVIEADLIV